MNGSCKKKCDKYPFNKLLTNEVLKADYKNYLKFVEKNKDIIKISVEDKVDQFLQEMKSRKTIVPPSDQTIVFTDKKPMGNFWDTCKYAKKCDKYPFNKLLTNEVLKADYIKKIDYLENNKNIVKISMEEKVNQFIQETESRQTIVSCSDKTIIFTDNKPMGNFWSLCKCRKKCGEYPYNKLLTNELLKADYEKHIEFVEKNKDKEIVSVEDKVNQLLQEMKRRNTIISSSDQTIIFTDKKPMGKFWTKCKSKKKCLKYPYKKLLTNEILKTDYEKYIEYVEDSKDVVKISLEDKVEQLLHEMKTHKKIISESDKKILFTDKKPMGTFWKCCKTLKRCDKKTYNKLLSNELLKKDYEKYLKFVESNKDVEKVSMEDKVNQFLQEMKNRQTIILNNDKKTVFTDKNLMGSFWYRCKKEKKCDKFPYDKLLTNEILKVDYEKMFTNQP